MFKMCPTNLPLYLLSFLVLYFQGLSGKEYIVQTGVGEIIGHTGTANFNGSSAPVLKFLGIPYAMPPVGDLRFRQPRRFPPFRTPYNAFALGPGCPQNTFLSSLWIPGPTSFDEDCLFLNIFIPFQDGANSNINISKNSYPVMIWIHGGAYMSGQSSMYSGDVISGFHDVIVVTINYRLGALGFLTTSDDEAAGNYGLWDQHLAIKWVHENIRHFGGDPGTVTLFGNSAGGSSVVYHALFPGNKGLIKRVISQSGSPISAWAFIKPDITLEFTKRFAEKMNCSTATSMDIIACLRQKPYEDIVSNSKVGKTIETMFRPEWCPVVDGDFIQQFQQDTFRNPLSMPKNSSEIFSEIDFMVGVSNGDGGFIAQTSYIPFIQKIMNTTNVSGIEALENAYIPVVLDDQYGVRSDILRDTFSFVYEQQNHPDDGHKYFHMAQDISTDINFAMSATFTLADHELLKNKSGTYLFRFSHLSSFNHDRPDWMVGANHGDELPYVFGFPSEMNKGFGFINNTTPEEIELSSAIMTYWTNFAKTGDPNNPVQTPYTPTWFAYTTQGKDYLDLDNPIGTKTNMFSSREALWVSLAPKLLQTISKGGTHTQSDQCSHQCPDRCSCLISAGMPGCWCPDESHIVQTTPRSVHNSKHQHCHDQHGVDCDYLAFKGICTNNVKLADEMCSNTCNLC